MSSGMSGAAMQRRYERQHKEQVDSLQKMLETAEQRLVEANKCVNKLTQELESSQRIGRQYERKCADFSKENQKLRAQLEAAVRVTNPESHRSSNLGTTHTPSSLAQSLSSRNAIALGEELKHTKAALERCTKDLERCKANESELMVRSKVLSDALEFRMEEIGLSGHADLLAKVASLRGEVSALRAELGECGVFSTTWLLCHTNSSFVFVGCCGCDMALVACVTSRFQHSPDSSTCVLCWVHVFFKNLGNKRDELQTVESERQDSTQKQESLQRQISLMQLRLSQSQEELHKLQLGDLPQRLKTLQQEKEVLLEFIEGACLGVCCMMFLLSPFE